MRTCRRGIELAPNYARGYEGLAAVLFQSVARRREALEMIEKARRLDPLELRLDVLKATYLLWGPGDMAQAAQVAEAVLERDPLYVPALVRLADVRWCSGQARGIRGAGRAGGGARSRQRDGLAAPVDELSLRRRTRRRGSRAQPRRGLPRPRADGAAVVQERLAQRPASQPTHLIAAGPSYRQIEPHIALAIRRHARLTGDYPRAIKALEQWASVTWEGDEPVLEEQLDMGVGVAALADMLMASGQKDRARALLEELLADDEVQISRYGRGEIWLNDGRAIAYALLGRPDEAVATLQRQAKLGFLSHHWRMTLEDEPAFDSLRARKDFQALVADARANEAREREEVPQNARGRPGTETELTLGQARSGRGSPMA